MGEGKKILIGIGIMIAALALFYYLARPAEYRNPSSRQSGPAPTAPSAAPAPELQAVNDGQNDSAPSSEPPPAPEPPRPDPVPAPPGLTAACLTDLCRQRACRDWYAPQGYTFKESLYWDSQGHLECK